MGDCELLSVSCFSIDGWGEGRKRKHRPSNNKEATIWCLLSISFWLHVLSDFTDRIKQVTVLKLSHLVFCVFPFSAISNIAVTADLATSIDLLNTLEIFNRAITQQ